MAYSKCNHFTIIVIWLGLQLYIYLGFYNGFEHGSANHILDFRSVLWWNYWELNYIRIHCAFHLLSFMECDLYAVQPETRLQWDHTWHSLFCPFLCLTPQQDIQGSQNLLIDGKFLNLITDKWGQCNDICIFQKRLWVSQLVIKNDDVAYLKKNFSNKACSKLVQVSMVTVTVETAEFRSYRK